jgi:hypothetical protein
MNKLLTCLNLQDMGRIFLRENEWMKKERKQ